MAGPAVVVTNSESPGAGGISLTTGTAFIVGEANYGPEEAKLVKSLAEFNALYSPSGRETGVTKLYDSVNTFFELEGQRAYINRVAGEGSPAAAKEELETAGKTKVLVVEAKQKGTYGNKLKIEVKSSGNTFIIFNPAGEVLEESGEFSKASELFEWGEKHTAYVVIKEGSNYSTGKGEAVKVLASKVLAGGANPTYNEKTTIKSIEGFAKNLGPGQLIASGAAKQLEGGSEAEKIHIAMGEVAQKNNRIAIFDLKEAEKAGTTVATLTGEKGTYAAGIAGYMITTSSAAVIPGTTAGTTRTVPGAAVVAGLCAKVSLTENDNQAPCGRTWPLQQFVISFTNTYSQTNIETLAEKNINAFAELPGGVLCLFGFESALAKETDQIFWQATASRERMGITFKSEQIGERFLFKTIDGRKQLLSRFQGELQGMLARQYELNALFGATAPEAFLVNVGEPINTPTTAAAGELNAELQVRLSPYANLVTIKIVSVPVSEPV